jgi:anti-sigma factor (TIGR02949 family)
VSSEEVQDWYLYSKMEEQGLEPSAEATVMESLPDEDGQKALSSLPEQFRIALLLADVEGFRYQEIAEITGVPIGTVMSRLHRGATVSGEAVVGCRPEGGAMSETTCDQILKEIELYLDSELGTEQAAALAEHLSECRSCFDRTEFQRRINQIVGTRCRSETPAHLWRRVRLALDVEAGRSVSAD